MKCILKIIFVGILLQFQFDQFWRTKHLFFLGFEIIRQERLILPSLKLTFVWFQEWKILHLLWWAVSGHNLQHYDAAKDPVLHGQLDHPLHGDLFLNSPHLLPSFWQWGEGLKQDEKINKTKSLKSREEVS